ncbi:WD40 repeat domain-containing serine/threonine protein kinase [Marinactinospora rubrisoli]|uniref:WD40 repeat domain-containing serine/threonine protein kinase n=1 Tax=Marinactinospora rubrisoli TaxID=2715399 RepID=A0ABW2KL47_9ACTN
MQPLTSEDPAAVGRYRLVARLGAGGMGRVYLARSPGGRDVALKVVHRDIAADPRFRQRFAREADIAQRVSGAFTAAVLDADPEAEVPWLATEYLAGPTLSAAVRRAGPLTESALAPLAAALAEALDAIHRAGLVHRDLKPGNILLSAQGPRVIDFGIAAAADGVALTRTGEAFGTLGYASPEQVQAAGTGPAGDVFSLGGVLLFAATGRPPFGTGAAATLVYRVVHEDPDLTGVPDRFRDLVAACLDKRPGRRPTPRQILRTLPPVGEADGWLPAPVVEQIDEHERTLVDVTVRARRRAWRWPRLAAAGAGVTAAALAVLLAARLLAAEDTATAAEPLPDPTRIDRPLISDPPDLGFAALGEDGTTVAWAGEWAADGLDVEFGGEIRALQLPEYPGAVRVPRGINVRNQALRFPAMPSSLAVSPYNGTVGFGMPGAHGEVIFMDDDVDSGGSSFLLAGDDEMAAENGVTALAFAPESADAVAGMARGSVIVLDSGTGEESHSLRHGRAPVTAADYSPDGGRIATGDAEGVVRVWDAATGDEEGAFVLDPARPVRQIEFTSGPVVARGGEESVAEAATDVAGTGFGPVVAWTPGDDAPVTLLGEGPRVTTMAADGDRDLLAYAVWRDEEPHVYLRRLSDPAVDPVEFHWIDGPPVAMEFTADGLLSTVSRDGQAARWEMRPR